MHPLSDALESFNRKERNLLVRAILGGQEGRLALNKTFCNQVEGKLGFSIPENAWWATDYHIGWLAGALALFVKGREKGTTCRWKNLKGHGQLVDGTQEDVDLVIATGCNLILIEAKAYGYFGNQEIAHKLGHLKLLHDFYCEMVGIEPPPEHAVNFHFLITSPRKPNKLKPPAWPDWACKGQDMPWIKLKLDNFTKPVFEVTRCDCDEGGTSNANGECWRVNKISALYTSTSC